MPYLKFDNPHPKGCAGNKGSCGDFISYLSKEDFKDMENPLSKEFLFNHTNQLIPDYIAIEAIDGNKKGLGRNDAKFYTGSINFSEEELRFIGNDPTKIKEYSIKVMEQYAQNFNRGITINDLVWFGKVEQNRYYKGNDPELISREKRQGDVKPGLNTHVHFIVGRKTLDGRKKISPKTNHRDTQEGAVIGGFDRNDFKQQCEAIFDEMFGYLRPLEESYQYLRARERGSVDERVDVARKYANELVKRESYQLQSNDQREYRIRQLANYICFGIDKSRTKSIDIEKLIEHERQSGYSGHIYRSLVNLNRACKQGKTPSEYDLTEKVLGFAKYLEFRKEISSMALSQDLTASNSQSQSPAPKVAPQIEKPKEQKTEPFIPLPSPLPNPPPPNDDELEILRRRKKKKKKNISRDLGMGM